MPQTSRELFNEAILGKQTSRPPIWIMRQAGRYLSEYRALKEKFGFLGIVKTPEAAVEAALQPIRRFGFDCAILFSDILAVSEALGFPYKFADAGGIFLPETAASERGVEKVCANAKTVCERLSYVAENAKLLRRELPDNAVIGFCGAPWTLAAYMVQGGSAEGFPKFREFAEKSPALFEKLMDALAEALARYLEMQADCGVDAAQIFDSHASLAPRGKFWQMSGRWSRAIIEKISKKTKVIYFAPKMPERLQELAPLGADAYSLGSGIKLSQAAAALGGAALQGNLDPDFLSNADPETAADAALKIARDMRGKGGHIFNLGHGIKPDAKIENVEAVCHAVKNFKDENA